MLFSSVALSIILSFISSEFFGLLSGGLISAGYLAYYFSTPFRILSTLILSFLIFFFVKILQNFIIIYGKRRFVLNTILSLLFVFLVDKIYFYFSSIPFDMRLIGYIIPGLIANDMEKQGVLKTLLSLSVVTLIVRLVLLLGV